MGAAASERCHRPSRSVALTVPHHCVRHRRLGGVSVAAALIAGGGDGDQAEVTVPWSIAPEGSWRQRARRVRRGPSHNRRILRSAKGVRALAHGEDRGAVLSCWR